MSFEPDTATGLTTFMIACGPLAGHNADGSIAGVVDAHSMYRLAVQHQCASHLRGPRGFAE